ncbi:10115_t:CDS:1, partial [Cetraspora pellucida]
PFLATKLTLVRARLFSRVEIPSKSNEMIKLCENFNLDSTIHDSFFKEAFQLALDKFDKHINNNSAISIFNATRCFDPCFIQLQPQYYNILLYKDIEEFKNPTNELIAE